MDNSSILPFLGEDDLLFDTGAKRISKSWLVFVSISVGGILLNVGVFWRRRKSTKRTSSTTKTSLFLLGIMAAADTLCLMALLFLLCVRYLDVHDPSVLSIVCKMDVFVIHTTSSFSIWCWLVLSAVRYMAVYKPYMHLKLSKEPRMAVIAVAIFCCITESWVLYDITYIPEVKACDSVSDEALNRKLQIFEIMVSYFLPVAFITVLDMKVLLCRAMWVAGITRHASKTNGGSDDRAQLSPVERTRLPSVSPEDAHKPSNGEEVSAFSPVNCAIYESGKIIGGTSKMVPYEDGTLKRASRSKKRMQQMKVLRRCLCITIFDLGMNLPNYLLRLYLVLISKEDYNALNMDYVGYVESISQIMYFAQFSLNALYLVCIIYDTPKQKGKIPVSTQVSNAYLSISPRNMSMKRSLRHMDSNALMV